MRMVAQSTQEAVKNLRIRRQLTLDAMIQRYDIHVSKGTLSRVLNGGNVSVGAELEVCRALHIEPEIRTSVPVCPSCLERNVVAVHQAADCHGKPVAAVVCLAPDETVRPVAKRRRSRATVGIGGLHPEVRAAHDARRNGKTWNQYLADMLQEPQP